MCEDCAKLQEEIVELNEKLNLELEERKRLEALVESLDTKGETHAVTKTI